MGEHVTESVNVVVDSDAMTENKQELEKLSLSELLKRAAEQGALEEK